MKSTRNGNGCTGCSIDDCWSAADRSRCEGSAINWRIGCIDTGQLSVTKVFPRRDIDAEHTAILEAVLARDADAAVVLLTGHYEATANIVRQDLDAAALLAPVT